MVPDTFAGSRGLARYALSGKDSRLIVGNAGKNNLSVGGGGSA
jgi:hypothetical protein